MSGHRYISNTKKLFEEEDVNDDTFVNGYRSRINPPDFKPTTSSYDSHIDKLERQTILKKQREIGELTLDSSARSIGVLRDTVQIGIHTSEVLVRQGEQLGNTNRRLDDINTNLKYSQKHLNGMKTIFSAIRNCVSSRSDKTTSRSHVVPDNLDMKADRTSNLKETIGRTLSFRRKERFNSHPITHLYRRRSIEQSVNVEPIPDSQRVKDILNANLGEMVQHISELRGIAKALGEEIDQQNKLLDTIQDKAEVADIKIGKQNKQMNKLMGK